MKTHSVHHINASSDNFTGNEGQGRYLFLTGSDERAKDLSKYFTDVSVHQHPRQHNLYIGKLIHKGLSIDVGSISTGMGGPSADIIINELILLGGRCFLRVGTAGSLQPQRIRVGDLVVATAAVRDDKASWDYIYREYPAIASLEFLLATRLAMKEEKQKVHFGIVHSKSSLYAREYGFSLLEENIHYMRTLRQAGVLATEMECAQLFTLSSLMNARLASELVDSPIRCGGILAIVGDDSSFSQDQRLINSTITRSLDFAVETIYQLASLDK